MTPALKIVGTLILLLVVVIGSAIVDFASQALRIVVFIDDAEAETRAKLAVPDRQLGTIDCAGLHHGERVTCHYAPATHPHSGRCS